MEPSSCPRDMSSRTVSYIIKPNTSTKVVTKLCRQPFKVSCLISYRSLARRCPHTHGCKSAYPRPSFFRRLSSKCRSSEGNKGRSSFVRGRAGVGWEEGDGSVCLSVCPFALLRANLALFMQVPKLAVTQVLLLSSVIHPTG